MLLHRTSDSCLSERIVKFLMWLLCVMAISGNVGMATENELQTERLEEYDKAFRAVYECEMELQKARATYLPTSTKMTEMSYELAKLKDHLEEVRQRSLADVKCRLEIVRKALEAKQKQYRDMTRELQPTVEEAIALKKEIVEWQGREQYLAAHLDDCFLEALTLDLGDGIEMQLRRLPAGTFLMGPLGPEVGLEQSDNAQQQVDVEHDFFVSIFRVTHEQYDAIVGRDEKRSSQKNDMNMPFSATWNQANEFCKLLSEKVGRKAVLPTEIQWEYAARAGSVTPFYTGWTLSTDQANIRMSPYTKLPSPKPVGTYRPNAFGLYDMYGTLWEWCSDEVTKEILPDQHVYLGRRMRGRSSVDQCCGGTQIGNPLTRGAFRIVVALDDDVTVPDHASPNKEIDAGHEASVVPMETQSELRVKTSTKPNQQPLLQEEPYRLWTTQTGQTAQLQLLLVEQGQATFIDGNCQQYRISVESLCETDRQYAQAFASAIEDMRKPNEKPKSKQDGEWVEFSIEAKMPYLPAVTSNGIVVDDLLEGKGMYYCQDRLCYVESYKNNKLHGPKIKFYPSGKVYSIRYFRDGLSYGKVVDFAENGAIDEYFTWQNGVNTGPRINYFQSGRICSIYPMVEGQPHGQSYHYLPSGELNGKQQWSAGELIGKNIFREINYAEYQAIIRADSPLFGDIWNKSLGVEELSQRPQNRLNSLRTDDAVIPSQLVVLGRSTDRRDVYNAPTHWGGRVCGKVYAGSKLRVLDVVQHGDGVISWYKFEIISGNAHSIIREPRQPIRRDGPLYTGWISCLAVEPEKVDKP